MCSYQNEEVNVCREDQGMSNHFLVEARLKLVSGWMSVRIEDGGYEKCVEGE